MNSPRPPSKPWAAYLDEYAYFRVPDMSPQETVIAELLPLQDAFNRKVNPEWIKAGFAWNRAIWMECAELVEGTQAWKWWKAPGKAEIEQLKLEVVDVLHFLLSWGLVQEARFEPGYAVKTIGGAFARYASSPVNQEFDMQSVIVSAERVVGPAADGNYHATVEALMHLCLVTQLTLSDLRRLYIGKNALNTVRNLNGYKTGTYQKLWRGEEDNVHLERLMSDQPDIGFQELVGTLTAIYREIHA